LAQTLLRWRRDGRAWKSSLKRILWPRLFRLADQVIVPSSGARVDAVSRPSIDHVTLTPYSVDNDWWIQKSAKSIGLPSVLGGRFSADIVILSAPSSALEAPLDLLRAFAKVQVSKALLVFAGEARFVRSSNRNPSRWALPRGFDFSASPIRRSFLPSTPLPI
jgi:hypothetical protein